MTTKNRKNARQAQGQGSKKKVDARNADRGQEGADDPDLDLNPRDVESDLVRESPGNETPPR